MKKILKRTVTSVIKRIMGNKILLLAPQQGGVAASSRKFRAATEADADEVVFLFDLDRKTTPASLSKDASQNLFNCSATPPCCRARRGIFAVPACFVVFVMILSTVCFAQTSPAPTGNVENGKKLFVKHDCYWCHGTAGQGGSAGARIGGTALSLQGVVRYVRQPAGAMPAFTDKVLTDQELTDIYAYLKSVQAPKTTAVPLLDSLKEK
jgi:mono/diheme cytochrome c family protein